MRPEKRSATPPVTPRALRGGLEAGATATATPDDDTGCKQVVMVVQVRDSMELVGENNMLVSLRTRQDGNSLLVPDVVVVVVVDLTLIARSSAGLKQALNAHSGPNLQRRKFGRRRRDVEAVTTLSSFRDPRRRKDFRCQNACRPSG
eukprot:766501-Hanusia_phi.AAC.2